MNTAKIIAITQPTWELTVNDNPEKHGRKYNAEEFIAYAARVSNPGNQHNTLTAPKLLQYLIKHKHWSPFEMVSITMEIETTRDIAHQIVRHRSFSFQEFSQRYADPTKDMGFVTREARLQDQKNRQNSIEINDDIMIDVPYCFDVSSLETKYEKRSLKGEWEKWQESLSDSCKSAYEWAIANGIAKEQARAVLPEGLTKTRLYMAGTLRSWIHYIDVRAEEGTQKEHRVIALAARDEILGHFPSLNDYWYSAPEPVIVKKPWWKFWA